MGRRDTNIQEPDAVTLFESTRCLRLRLANNQQNISVSEGSLNENPSTAMASLSPDNNNTTSFSTDNENIGMSHTRSETIPIELGPQVPDIGSIKDFLAKPYPIVQGTYTTASAINSVLYTVQIGDILTAFPIYKNKVSGYDLVRGCVKLKVVMNADPFQQGRLICHFIPCFKHFSSTWQAARNLNLCAVTQTPCVEMDLRQTEVELCVPYVAPTPFMAGTGTANPRYDWGTFWVRVLAPMFVGSGGSTSVGFTVFASFHDVELTTQKFGPESGKGQLAKESKSQSSSGLLSSATDSISNIAGALGFNSAAWGIRKVGEVAKVFGFSKPIVMSQNTFMVRNPMRHVANSEGEDTSDPLSMAIRPQLDVSYQVFGSKVDEMSFAYIKSVPALFTTVSWTSASAVGATICTCVAKPDTFGQSGTKVSGANSVTYTVWVPFAYVSRMFNHWRGGIRITVKIPKTVFHSGRLLVTWDPTATGAAPIVTASTYLQREIIDIRERDEFSFVLPYMAAPLWLDLSESSGTFAISVLTPLRAPSTCSQTVSLLVYASAADDYELAFQGAGGATVFSPESGHGPIVDKSVGNTQDDKHASHYNATTHGDVFASLKQLLVSSRYIYGLPLANTSTSWYPIANGITTYTSGTSLVTPPMPCGDLFDMICSGYAFKRGSVRLSAVNDSPTIAGLFYDWSTTQVKTLAAAGLTSSVTSSTPITSIFNRNYLMDIIPNNRHIDVTIPYYGKVPFTLCDFIGNGTSLTLGPHSPSTRFFYSSSTAPTQWARAGGDDFSVGYFIGFLPLVTLIS